MTSSDNIKSIKSFEEKFPNNIFSLKLFQNEFSKNLYFPDIQHESIIKLNIDLNANTTGSTIIENKTVTCIKMFTMN